MQESQTKTIMEMEHLTVSEMARYLRVSVPYAYRLTHESDFPCTNIGKRIIVSRRLLDAWILARTKGQREA